jgi:pilus assembly protein CpaF
MSAWNFRRATPTPAPEAISQAAEAKPAPASLASGPVGDHRAFTELKVTLHQQLLDIINLSVLDDMSREQIEAEIGTILHEEMAKRQDILNRSDRKRIISEVLDELLGLGPLEPLLKDDSISDILVNGPHAVFVERRGTLSRASTQFQDDKHLLRIIQKIVAQVGRRVDETSPMVDARLPDGSRVNAVVAPLALDGPFLSVRKFSRHPISMDGLVEFDSLTPAMAQVLHAAVHCRRNIVISGGTGSGKTTLLNALSSFIDEKERIVTIEDSAELQLQQEHVARLETRPASMEGAPEISQRDLVKNALRMRPDRIIVGEVRSGEAFDMLQAMNTGHEGSMTTVHANSPRDALGRVEQMIGMSGIEISAMSARAQIASAINVIVQVSRLHDGRRKITSIAEVIGMESEIVTLQELFRYKQTSRTETGDAIGHFEALGVRPRFADLAAIQGVTLDQELFRPGPRV